MRRVIHRLRGGRPIRPGSALALLVALAVLGGCGDDGPGGDDPEVARFDAARAYADLRAQAEIGPRPSGSPAARRTAGFIAASLRKAGAEDVLTQRPVRNVVATLPGESPGYVVLGAHYDTKEGIPAFQGANDGASGVAAVLELARALPAPLPGPSIAIALFDGEEARGDRPFQQDGMRGSRQYVGLARRADGERQGTPPLEQIRAMVLLDMVGDCDLAIPHEAYSDRGLYEQFAAQDPELLDGETVGLQDDHLPFLDAGIPAVNLIDLTYGPGPPPGSWWHTPRDTVDRVCEESLGAIGSAVERGLLRPDGLG